MLSLQYIREHEAELRQAMANRHTETPLDRILELDSLRRELLQEREALQAQRNQLSSQIGKADPATRQSLIDQTRGMSARISELEPQVKEIEGELDALLLQMPNVPDPSVVVGANESDNLEVRRWGTKRQFDFTPKPHWELGEALGIVDFERGANLAGSRFEALIGDGATLSRALANLMLEIHLGEHGYTEVSPPYLVKPEVMVGTGQLPKFGDDAYQIESDELYLIPTAEVPVTNLHRGEILPPDVLPIKYVAYSACFRREAGAAGRDTRGLIRRHQFHKVEMVKFAEPEQALDELESMVRDAESILQALELPYRVMLLCTGDMGFTSRKTYDLEVWMPGLDRYVEISSCSTCGDFQARRADIKFRRTAGAHAELVHTLNGSGLAVGRTIAALLENYQHENGSVEIPEALHGAFGGRTELAAPRFH
ncbi:MAG: seryl-tRNA synthetase [Chloroflexota bacterium]|nr:seryl-tRNA synthetase [Chloroflexota bacterium]